MKANLTLIAVSSMLLTTAPELLAQNTNTNLAAVANTIPLTQTVKYQAAVEHDRALGQRSLLPPGLKERMILTKAQRAELKAFEDDFANTSQKYQATNKLLISNAQEAMRQARITKDPAQIAAARTQLQQLWVGLQPYRADGVTKIKPLLTPDQLKILEAPDNQWNENHTDEANDPSEN
ncbi:MAG: hypothetical protein H7X97_00135 [Opitutaceae bacterium]|nr:hypothetical protein [Verrucomicrobiales bacterium]